MTHRRLQELLAPVLAASHEADLRRETMRHLCDCLSEPTGKRWQRIYGGLVLAEKLVQQGSHVLLIETAHGHHFDLVQKVSFLEHFDSAARGCSDRRAQHCIRKKAGELRTLLIPQLKKASHEELPQNAGLGIKDSISTCSPGALSNCTTDDVSMNSLSGGSLASASSRASPADNLSEHGLPAVMSGLVKRLRTITESEASELKQEQIQPVLEASHDSDSRQVIMWHLQRCLMHFTQKPWRHVHGGLLVTEALLEHGSPLIFTEPTPGVDLDLPKQIWLLEQFECRADWRAQNMVREKAISLWEKMVPWLLNADKEPELVPEACEQIDEAFSTLRSWAESMDSTPSWSGHSAEPSPSEASPGTAGTELQCDAGRVG
eukprot:CAMPEP_0171200404 /NCGR_PEP_ID=MMETSP0790-20130122/23962_1 /TAXON_ID=2925 /ORGANISM="Alexandrium catenella, Strain OF101" /LENGTH=375 /DNA_ID=CAMNT_0011665781 /DNA_START=258 /DNA_END=1381 /DNA_ORIENTATION=+